MAIALNEGIDKISIRKVAGVCNIAIGSIYNYFPNKEALTLAITEQFWAKVLENQDKIYRRGMGSRGEPRLRERGRLRAS